MFEKLLSNLPYNSSIVSDLAFYAKRIRKEESIRRLGFLFILLTFFVQFFAFLSPPKPSLAASTNDMINGGFASISELVADCNANIKQYRTIINYYGLSCSNLASGQTVSLVSTSYNKKLFSMGWNPQGSINVVTKKPTDEQPVDIPHISSPLYWRYLWSWDTYAYSTYEAVRVTSNLTHKTYFVLYACGNLVSIGLPSAYIPPKPKPIVKPKPIIAKPKPTYKPKPVATTQPTVTTQPTTTVQPTVTTQPTTTVQPTVTTQPTKQQPLCSFNDSIAASSPNCKPCAASLSSYDTIACIKYSKTASDLTEHWNNANGKIAQPGDVIMYTLTAFNSGDAVVKDFVMQDDLSYVLDYAKVLNTDGGQINNNDIISWPAVTVLPNKAISHTVEVSIFNPIPSTLPSTSDPELYDHIMTNIYGNTINIYLPKSPITTVASITTTSLPNTGPGNGLIIAAIIVIVAGYFLARSKLILRESNLAIKYNNGGNI